ncbi:MAG: hypothetical protein RLZZ592_1882 [Pseudomonadota bacterium]|jgi:PAS domain S-box-containing protein
MSPPDTPPPSAVPPEPAARSLIDSGRLLWIGVTLLISVALLSAAYAARQRQLVVAEETRRMAVLVRVLQGEAQRLLDASALMLQTLASQAGEHRDPDLLRSRMVALLRTAPQMRSLWLIDANGRVITSTSPQSGGRSLDTSHLALPRQTGEVRLGSWQSGRDLIQDGPAPVGMGLLTLAVNMPADGPATSRGAGHLIATLNPDALATLQQRLLGEGELTAALLDLSGQILSGTDRLQSNPGELRATLPALQDFLPEREHGSYNASGLDGTPVLASFDASGRWPVFTLLEQPRDDIEATVQDKLLWSILMMCASMGLIGLGTLLAWRALRTQEQLMQALQHTRSQLVDSEGHLRTLIEAAPAAMFVIDPLGRYAMVNQAFEDLLDVRREQLLGQRGESHARLRQLAYHQALDHALWSSTGSGRSHYVEEFVLQGGERRQMLVTKVTLRRPGERSGGIIGSLTDVTSFHEAEQRAAEARQVVEAAYQAESEFIGNLSHALRTPLQSIIGFSELGRLRTRRDTALQELFGHVHQAGMRMLDVVDDLLDLSRVKSSAGTLHCSPADTLALVQEVIRHARQDLSAQDRPIRLQHMLERGAWASVDALRFQQVIRLLLERTITQAPERDPIEITVTVDAQQRLHWTLRDTGATLPESEHEHIFSAFFQSRRNSPPSAHGSGLELQICRQIMRGLGGDLVYRTDAQGGEFDLWLPSLPSRPHQPDSPAARSDEHAAEKKAA